MSNENYLKDYERIIGKSVEEPYNGAEEQGRAFKKFSLLKNVDIWYSTHTMLTNRDAAQMHNL